MSFIDRLANTSATAASDDGSVRGNYSPRTGVEITLRPQSFQDERVLGERITRVVGRLHANFARKLATSSGDRPPAPGVSAQRRVEKYAMELSEVVAVHRSDSDLVKARMTVQEGIVLRIRPGALRRIDSNQLQTEANAVLAAVARQFGAERSRLHRRWFSPQPPRG